MQRQDITKKQTIPGTATVSSGKINVAAEFSFKLSDYNITGVPVEAGKVAKEPKVTVSASF